MNFVNELMPGFALIPGLVSVIEALFRNKSGTQKKDAAMRFLENALAVLDAAASRKIVDAAKFRDGLSKIIDGTVECLNASAWAKETRAQKG